MIGDVNDTTAIDGSTLALVGQTQATLLCTTEGLTVTATGVASSQPVTVTRNGLGTTPTPAYTAANTTPATAIATVQCGPSWNSLTHVWDSDKGGGGADATVELRQRALPVTGTAPYAEWIVGQSVDGAAYADVINCWNEPVSATSRLLLGGGLFLRRSGSVHIYNAGTQINWRPDGATDTIVATVASGLTTLVAGVASALTVGDRLRNSTAATNTVEQFSPARCEEHYAWNTGGAASEKWELFKQGRSVQGNPSIGYWVWSSKRAAGSEVNQFSLSNIAGATAAWVGGTPLTESLKLGFGSACFVGPSSLTNPGAAGKTLEVAGQDIDGTGTQPAGHLILRSGAGSGPLHTGGNVTIDASNGTVADGSLELRVGGNAGLRITAAGVLTLRDGTNEKIAVDTTGIGAFGHAPAGQSADIVAITDNTTGTPSRTFAAMPTLTDSPASADALRDDLEAVWKPAINTLLASVADFCNDARAHFQAHGWMA